MGILAGAIQGIGEAGLDLTKRAADYLARSELQSEAAEIQKLRDQRLQEFARSNLDYAHDLKTKDARAAAADIEAGKGAMVDDPSGTARPRTRSEQAEFESGAYRKRGMIQEALSIEDREFRKDEAGKADLARTRDDNRADSQLAEQARHNKAIEAAQAASNARLAALAKVQTEAATFDLETKKDLKKLQDEYTAETDPAKRATIERTILTRLGKAKELSEPVKAYVDTVKSELAALTKVEAETGSLPPASLQRRAELQRQMANLATTGTLGLDKAPSPAAGAKWDSATGDVMLDGKKIGTAKSQDEARSLVQRARKPAPQSKAAEENPTDVLAQIQNVSAQLEKHAEGSKERAQLMATLASLRDKYAGLQK